jgi:monothiol glutaredoxin
MINESEALADSDGGKDHECRRFHPQRSELQRNRSVYERHAGRAGLRILCASGANTRPSRRGLKSHNIYESEELRQGIKDYSDWPTIPQLYVRGEFVGGCDIVTEMFQSGELQALLKKVPAPS